MAAQRASADGAGGASPAGPATMCEWPELSKPGKASDAHPERTPSQFKGGVRADGVLRSLVNPEALRCSDWTLQQVRIPCM